MSKFDCENQIDDQVNEVELWMEIHEEDGCEQETWDGCVNHNFHDYFPCEY